jgi:hypothetical protein
MDKLTEALESLSTDSLVHIRSIIGVTSSAGKQALLKAMLTVGGIDRILSGLSSEELAFLYSLWKSKSGLTYSELSRELSIDSDEIEKIALTASSRLLVYILKNRRHLNNRLDKVYLHEPIAELFMFGSDNDVTAHARSLAEAFIEPPSKKSQVDISKKVMPLFDALIDEGGASHYTALSARFEQDQLDAMINEGIAKENIRLIHTVNKPFASLILIHPKAAAATRDRKDAHVKTSFDNRYNLLNNLLCVYDMVTSRGLYLTQQHDFRKTDFKRVSDSLIPLYDHRGMTVDAEESARLALHILNRLGTLHLKKEAINIDLTPLERELLEPAKLQGHALKAALKKGPDDPLFASPFAVPTNEEIHAITGIIGENNDVDLLRLKMQFCAARIEKHPLSIRVHEDRHDHPSERFTTALRYALLFGIVSIEEGFYRQTLVQTEHVPSVYINPDFTILIPARELPRDLLYRILSCTELVKNDVIMQCKISKDSILAAHKRHMHPDRVIIELEKYLKNGIPQNMLFMIGEWIAQSLELQISDVLLLKVNHASFIDDLLAGSLAGAIIERISPTHAIIQRDMLDEIVRSATKHNAIISLFAD